MFYYRFRPMNQLTIKELLYDEVYFSYPDELNDPMDGIINYIFSEDYPKWKGLLDYVWKELNVDSAKYADYFARKSPISLRELAFNTATFFKEISPLDKTEDKSLVQLLYTYLKIKIQDSIPPEGCSVSFSKKHDDILMWSHYTGKHNGFCLIFRSIDDELKCCPNRKKVLLSNKEYSSAWMRHNYKFKDVSYEVKNKNTDAFLLFPACVYGRQISKEEHTNYWNNLEDIFLTKSPCWSYEEEVRLHIPSYGSNFERERLSPLARIFHYDNSQLAGVIYGSRMSDSDKKIIREILLRKSYERHMKRDGDTYIINIVAFEASFNEEQHIISNIPVEIFECGKIIDKTSPDFCEKLSSWEKGEAHLVQYGEKGFSSKKIILD
ncbi:DUF2971 domain-containing protein [Enterobacter mori]|uniref:DUF2971 domain-containing protein n=1 Tax=Enterobacter mori TaxID=539813 RepID=UPI003B83F930